MFVLRSPESTWCLYASNSKGCFGKGFEYPLLLKKADHLKFMVMIDPWNTQTVVLDIAYKFIEEGDINVTAKVVNGDVVCFKFQGRFVKPGSHQH
ncbi:MAG: FabA-like domain protein [Mucilaginibacter sp.]|jgi:hypothetical protein|nr:FabA-like domain protein [Mucilaginibacter sp.]